MHRQNIRDNWERVAKTTKAQWDASPYVAPPIANPRQSLLAMKANARNVVRIKDQYHA
jgi:hypothetical protein